MYGYCFQLYRVLDRLVSYSEAQAVAIETLDDVVQYNLDGIVAEQDKATLARTNPLTDSSINLWKTLNIWTKLEAKYGAGISQYVLLTNSKVLPRQGTFIARMCALNGQEDKAKTLANDLLSHKSKSEPISDHIAELVREKHQVLSVLCKVSAQFDEQVNAQTIASKLQCPKSLQCGVAECLMGWLFVLCMRKWEAGEPAKISRSNLLKEFTACVQRLNTDAWRVRPEAQIALTSTEIAKQQGKKFVNHLIAIKIEDDCILSAIEDYLRTKSEHTRLLDEGEVLPSDFTALADNCHRIWDRKRKSVTLIHANLPPVQQGQTIFHNSLDTALPKLGQETVTEEYFKAGTFHSLADEDRVYWHPQYSGIFPVDEK